MKKIHILISSMLCLGLASCFDMNQEPQGELSSSEAFSTVAEIQSYLNMFYQGSVPVSSNNNSTVTNSAIKTQSSSQSNGIAFGDMNSDNLLPGTFDTRLAGQMSSAGSELSDYKPIRNVNFLLQNINRCEDQESSSFKQCVGEAYYFRAAYYYSLLKDYGGVTWVDTPLDPDAGQMQLPRNTRTELTNYILKDLDDAIANLNEQNSNSTGRVHRDVARALKSEVALFAATWEKYHRADNDPFYDKTLTNADEQIRDWLTQAANAAKEVMIRKVWSISRQNNDPLTDYRDLFVAGEDAQRMRKIAVLHAVNHIYNDLECKRNRADKEARDGMSFANMLSGMVMTLSGCTSKHGMEHAMSALSPNLAHGAGLIMLAPAYYEHMIEVHACDERFVKMARSLGMENASEPSDFVKALKALIKECGVDDLKMSDYGIKPENFENLAKNAMSSMKRVFLNDRVPMSLEDVVSVYSKSYK